MNCLELNPSITDVIIFRTNEIDNNITLGKAVIQCLTSVKFLGVHIDRELKMHKEKQLRLQKNAQCFHACTVFVTFSQPIFKTFFISALFTHISSTNLYLYFWLIKKISRNYYSILLQYHKRTVKCLFVKSTQHSWTDLKKSYPSRKIHRVSTRIKADALPSGSLTLERAFDFLIVIFLVG